MEVVRCFKCGKKGYKCKWCPLWKKEKRVAHPQRESTPRKKGEAGVPRKRESTEREREETEESRGGRSGAPYKGKCAAREVEKEFVGDIKKEG